MRKHSLYWVLFAGLLAGSTTIFAQSSVTEYTYFPIVTHLSVSEDLYFATVFILKNQTEDSVSGSIHVRRADGSEISGLLCGVSLGVPVPGFGPIPFSVPASSVVRVPMTVLPGSDLSPHQLNGWAALALADQSDVQASAEIALLKGQRHECDPLTQYSTEEILDIVSLPASETALRFGLSITIIPSRRTAISFVNPSGTETAHVTLQLQRGTSLDNSAVIEVPPLRRISHFLLDIVLPEGLTSEPTPGDPNWQFLGAATITSDIPIAVGALDVILPDGKLVYVPVGALED